MILPGKSAQSVIIHLISGLKGEDNLMPQKGERLTAEQIGLLRAWIDQGIETSSDLKQWDPLATLLNNPQTWQFTDTSASGVGQRFYRLRKTP